MAKNLEIGKLGEDIACEYFITNGFTIIERNFRKPWGELDIIAKDKKGTLVFVEVKTMRQFGNAAIAEYEESFKNNPAILRYARHNSKMPMRDLSQLNPEENLTVAKLKKLKRTSQLYAGFHEELIEDKKGWRIDLIAITLKEAGDPEIKHFENI